MSLACIVAPRLRVVPLRLAVAVAVLGGIGPFFGSYEFVRAGSAGDLAAAASLSAWPHASVDRPSRALRAHAIRRRDDRHVTERSTLRRRDATRVANGSLPGRRSSGRIAALE